ncbi:nucleoside phosphorylase [Clostridium sp. AM58-1XD]|uniref:nucleoside phosphorylase n=1 Tax=Clostridium sp. AM58-1XD TaxID=2292307 RepID=UPI000E47E5B0|nr:nucleoside phosphorylase [Clostridium sp. AM58-1XD]RGZ01603.1 nucleoside phosphorylase [Clostridium sp. AM58-1XD]
MGGVEKQPHILISTEDAAEYAVIPGDPKRVERIAEYLENVRELAFNREYYSIRGQYKGVPVIALSTGIGGPSAAIAIEEMKAIGVRTILRIGSCGALQSNMMTGDLIISTGSVRDDGTTSTYVDIGFPAVPDLEITGIIQQVCRKRGFRYHSGITRSHDSYYADTAKERTDYWHSRGILGEDLETAALFVVAGLRGLRAASILNIVVEWEGDVKEGIHDYVNDARLAAMGEENEILAALETIAELEARKGYRDKRRRIRNG